MFTRSAEELDALKRESLKLIEAHDITRTLTTFERLYRGEVGADPQTVALPEPVQADPSVLDSTASRD